MAGQFARGLFGARKTRQVELNAHGRTGGQVPGDDESSENAAGQNRQDRHAVTRLMAVVRATPGGMIWAVLRVSSVKHAGAPVRRVSAEGMPACVRFSMSE